MVSNRLLWTPVGLVGVGLTTFNIAVHGFGWSPSTFFGSRDLADVLFPTLVSSGILGCVLLWFRGTYYRSLDTGLIVTAGFVAAVIASSRGTFMHDDFEIIVLVRGLVYVGGLAMIRAWYVSGLPYPGPGASVTLTNR